MLLLWFRCVFLCFNYHDQLRTPLFNRPTRELEKHTQKVNKKQTTHLAVARDKQVGRAQVAVHELAAVQVHHAGGDVVQHLQAARPRQVRRVPFF